MKHQKTKDKVSNVYPMYPTILISALDIYSVIVEFFVYT